MDHFVGCEDVIDRESWGRTAIKAQVEFGCESKTQRIWVHLSVGGKTADHAEKLERLEFVSEPVDASHHVHHFLNNIVIFDVAVTQGYCVVKGIPNVNWLLTALSQDIDIRY